MEEIKSYKEHFKQCNQFDKKPSTKSWTFYVEGKDDFILFKKIFGKKVKIRILCGNTNFHTFDYDLENNPNLDKNKLFVILDDDSKKNKQNIKKWNSKFENPKSKSAKKESNVMFLTDVFNTKGRINDLEDVLAEFGLLDKKSFFFNYKKQKIKKDDWCFGCLSSDLFSGCYENNMVEYRDELIKVLLKYQSNPKTNEIEKEYIDWLIERVNLKYNQVNFDKIFYKEGKELFNRKNQFETDMINSILEGDNHNKLKLKPKFKKLKSQL